MDKDTRNTIERMTQRARRLLEDDFAAQLEGDLDVHVDGAVGTTAGAHLSARHAFQRERIVAAIAHKRAAGMSASDSVTDYLRDAAFTTLNRFVALKMLESRELVQECITKGDISAGYREFCGMAQGLTLLPDSAGYRLYIESLFDELSTEVKVLFDRRDQSGVLWPRRTTFDQLLEILNATELANVWGEDETIGWMYQFFNSGEERREMRESQAPRTSRELAVRNQFFTPRYVVDFLVENTVSALWVEMTSGESRLRGHPLLVPHRPTASRQRKDPRDIHVLDPACGSGHFLLRSFDVLASIYREAWSMGEGPRCNTTGTTLCDDFPTELELDRQLPRLILKHNLFGIDIDARCVQIASLALWMRAQRAWNDQGISRGARPSVNRTNIVIAEPIPAIGGARDAFLAGLEPDLRRLAEALFARLELAGEAGALLDIHEWFRTEVREVLGEIGGLFSNSDKERWAAAETTLLERFHVFAAKSEARREWGSSLFANDAVRGLAFIDLTRKTFDVVLMNPPFGDPIARARSACGAELAISENDLGGAFVLAAERRWAPKGIIGVLSSTTLWFKPTAADWRSTTLLSGSHSLDLAAHLGGQVLDGAKVSASAITLRPASAGQKRVAIFLRLPLEEQKEARLYELAERIRDGSGHSLVYQVDLDSVAGYRGAPLAYWISPSLRSRLSALPALECRGAEVRVGVQCSDDPRFVRAWWELPVNRIGVDHDWLSFAKSSEYSPFWDDITWVIRWKGGGDEVRAFDRSKPQNTQYFCRSGVTYPARSYLGFNPRAFPSGSGFGHMGSVAFPLNIDAPALLGYLASRPLEYVLSFSNGSLQGDLRAFPNHYEVGQIKDLPWPGPSAHVIRHLSQLGDAIATAAMHLQDDDETTHQYVGHPILSRHDSIREAIETLLLGRQRLVREIRTFRSELDEVVGRELGFAPEDFREMEAEFALYIAPTSGPWSEQPASVSAELIRQEASSIASALFGFAIGHLDIRPAAAGVRPACRASAFDPLPATGPAHLHGRVPENYPIPIPAVGILVADGGSQWDVAQSILGVIQAIWLEKSAAVESELASLLGVDSLSQYFVGKGARTFFADHLARYSKGRRTAPIYWQIATPSASYSLWLYIQAFTKDTVFRIQNDYLVPKLSHEARRLDSMSRELGDGATATAVQRKELIAQEAFVEELRALVEELKRIAPLWNPNLNDGVLVNFAPLWRVVSHHKPWQKELKSTWDALCEGKYDWSHLAMRLWPERVIPKCGKDRSLAIAHDLEHVFWVEGDDGKFVPRKTLVHSIDELVRERTSSAVKAALKSLVDASTASASGVRGGNGRRRSTPAEEGVGDARTS